MKRTLLLYALYCTLTGQPYEPRPQSPLNGPQPVVSDMADGVPYESWEAVHMGQDPHDLPRVHVESSNPRDATGIAF